MEFLVTYDIRTPDIAGQRRLARVAAICERYGTRIQYAVFACRLSDLTLQRLITDLELILDPAVDAIDIYRVPGTLAECRTSLGRPPTCQPGAPWIL